MVVLEVMRNSRIWIYFKKDVMRWADKPDVNCEKNRRIKTIPTVWA